jgi:Lon protease-like protein
MKGSRHPARLEPECVSASGVVPVFPLPGVVLFPRTVLPLHVFEPRYRTMVRDATAGEGLIAIALLKAGWEEDYAGSPSFHETGTVGRIEDLEPLPGGKFNLRLVGLQRVRFGEVVRSAPYRLVRVRPLAESPVDDADPEVRSAKLSLLASHGCLIRELADRPEGGAVLDERIPFETAVNGACANLPVDPAKRQSLLEEDDLFARQRRASAMLDEILERVLRLKALRTPEEGGSGLN